ncbi:MAG: glycoside hydrolase family 32 protein [Mucilaginibacter sp.]
MRKLITLSVLIGTATCRIACLAQSPISSKTDTVTYHEKYRPQYHLTSPKGALFDPTDLVYYDHLYHVNKGFASSPDLVHWKIGVRKSVGTDSVREMSGSLVIDSLNTSGFGGHGIPPLVAIYSGLRKNHEQIQCIAYSSDSGEHWQNYNQNPVIDIHSTEFRDPQVFWYSKENKWVMVVALAAERKIRFYESKNLKQWNFLSDFGPYGAVNGVWECPDFFRLPVKNRPGQFKWVLEMSVQPVGGQYFIGDFNGREFLADNAFRIVATPSKIEGTVIFDFESGLAGWVKTGDAFNASPSNGPLKGQNAVLGYRGSKLLNSYNGSDAATGTIMSPRFYITKKYLNFLIGGGLFQKDECVNLIIDGKVVRTKSGTDAEVLSWTGWDVSAFKGKEAQIQLVDNQTGPFGHILFDELVASDELAVNKLETAHWLDFGPDFYAVRSWLNGPDNFKQRISIAWLGSWQYAIKVPTKPWKGGHTFPRAVEIIKEKDNYRLLQNPVNQLATLRGDHETETNITLTDVPHQLKVKDNNYELLADFGFVSAKKSMIKLVFCGNAQTGTIVAYNAATKMLSVDRRKSGITNFSPAFPAIYSAPLDLDNGHLKLHVLVDRSSIEVFGNDGRANITCQIFPEDAATTVSLQAINGPVTIKKLDFWTINSIWPSIAKTIK